MTDETPGPPHRLEGPRLDAGFRRAVLSPQQPVHRAGRAVPVDRRQLGRPRRRADRRDPVRRPPRHERPAGQRVPELAARRLHRRDRRPPSRPLRPRAPSARCAATRSAMLPFCGYNMADYWGHWLEVGKATTPDKLPRIFQVNWFRKDADGHLPVAGLRREQPGAGLGHPSGAGQGRRGGHPDRPCTRCRLAEPGRARHQRARGRGAVRREPGELAGGGRPDARSTSPSSAATCPQR